MRKGLKQQLTLSFRELRTKGYECHQNWMCCCTCGWEAIKKDKAVFYTQQEYNDLYKKSVGFAYLSWSGDGHEIVRVLKRHGLIVEWNELDTTCIKVS